MFSLVFDLGYVFRWVIKHHSFILWAMYLLMWNCFLYTHTKNNFSKQLYTHSFSFLFDVSLLFSYGCFNLLNFWTSSCRWYKNNGASVSLIFLKLSSHLKTGFTCNHMCLVMTYNCQSKELPKVHLLLILAGLRKF